MSELKKTLDLFMKDALIERIIELEEQLRFRPVSEGLPTEKGWYEIIIGGGYRDIDYFTPSYIENHRWNKTPEAFVDYWRPIPELEASNVTPGK